MGELTQDMAAESVRALESGDGAAARKVIAGDAAVDVLEQEAVSALLGHASREPRLLPGALRLAYAARSLERVGDHATNVAEMALSLPKERSSGTLRRELQLFAGRAGLLLVS